MISEVGPRLAVSITMSRADRPLLGLLATTAAASLTYLAITQLVQTGKTRRKDKRARRKALRAATPRARRVADITGHIGKWYMTVPLALGGAALLARRDHREAAATLAASSIVAAIASPLLDRVHELRKPPPGKGDPNAQSFPSGHALETTTVSLVAAWILARERIAPASAVAPAAVAASAISGLGRLVLDRHWTTDSIAGYLAGIALGSACAAGYEAAAR